MINRKQQPSTIEHLFFILLLPCILATGCDAEEEFLRNIALNKPYSVTPVPNYPWCTDPGDASQLTDGKKTGAIWTKKSTVGWHKPASVIRIDIDLKGLFRIDTVRAYTTTGGHPDVWTPRYMAVLTSRDGKEYVLAQVIAGGTSTAAKSPTKREKQPVTLKAAGLDVSARHVRLLFRPDVRYVFLDEIEIIGHETDSTTDISKGALLPREGDSSLLRSIEEILDLQESLSSLKERVDGQVQLTPSRRKELQSKIDLLTGELSSLKRAGLTQQIQEKRNQIGLLRAQVYQEQFKKPLLCLSANPMAVLKRSDMPSGAPCSSLQFSLWRAEHETSAVNLASASSQPLEITATIESFADEAGHMYDAKQTFTIRRAEYTFVNTLGFIGDALVRQGGDTFTIQPGRVTQLWITAFNPTLPSGKYRGSLVVNARSGDGQVVSEQSIPLRMHIWPLRMPSTPNGEYFNWAYYGCGTEEETALDLELHHTTVAFLNVAEAALPPRNSRVFQMPNKASFDRMDRAIRRHSYARQYILFLNFRKEQKDWGRFGQWMSPQWKSNFTAWLRILVRHLRQQGLGYDRWILHAFDETLCDEFLELASFIKQTNPQVRLFADHINDKPATIRKFRDVIDIWCPNERHIRMYPDRLELVRSFGKPVWMYKSQGPGRANDPYSYYRLAHWRAFQYGLNGVGFWVYHDKNGPVVWDEIGNIQGYYGVIYSGSSYPGGSLDESIVPSRRWEAWREGIEDSEYLRRFEEVFKQQGALVSTESKISGKDIQRQIEDVIRNPGGPNRIHEMRRMISEYLVQQGVP